MRVRATKSFTTGTKTATGTITALSRARDLLQQRGMHRRAATLGRLAEQLANVQSKRKIVRNSLEAKMLQLRPGGTRGEAL